MVYLENKKKYILKIKNIFKKNKKPIILLIVLVIVPSLFFMMKDSPRKAMRNFVKSYNTGSGHSVVKTTSIDLSGTNNIIKYNGVKIKDENHLGSIYDQMMKVNNIKIINYNMKKTDDINYEVKLKLKDKNGDVYEKTCFIEFVRSVKDNKLRVGLFGSNLLEYISGLSEK